MSQPSMVVTVPVPVPVATALAWLGLYVHNERELPGHTLLSPETFIPGLVSTALLTWWILTRGRRREGRSNLAVLALLGWGWLHLVGGALSVLPLMILPFEPEQSVRHYATHVLYALTQVPLVVTTTQLLRTGRNAAMPHRGHE